MKIAYFITSLSNSGPINVANDLVNVMIEHGHKCDVYYFKDKIETLFKCPTHRISLTSRIDLKQYDVVHAHGFLADLYLFLHMPCGKYCNPKYFTTIHSFIFEDHYYAYGPIKSFFTTYLTIFATRRADKVIVLGKTAIKHFEGHISKRRLVWAYNTRVIDIYEPIDVSDNNIITKFKTQYSTLLGVVCGLNKRKAIEQIVNVLTLLPKTFGLIIVGDGTEKDSLIKLAYEHGVSERILFLGNRSRGFRYLKVFDIFVLPSRSEGFPLALLEAACASKPSVTSDIPVFNEIFNDNETVKFNLDNLDSLRDAILKCVDNKEKLGIAFNTRFLKDYSPAAFYERHYNIYTSND